MISLAFFNAVSSSMGPEQGSRGVGVSMQGPTRSSSCSTKIPGNAVKLQYRLYALENE